MKAKSQHPAQAPYSGFQQAAALRASAVGPGTTVAADGHGVNQRSIRTALVNPHRGLDLAICKACPRIGLQV